MDIGSRCLDLLIKNTYALLDEEDAYKEIRQLQATQDKQRQRKQEQLRRQSKVFGELEPKITQATDDGSSHFMVPMPKETNPFSSEKSATSTIPIISLQEAIERDDCAFLVEAEIESAKKVSFNPLFLFNLPFQ